MSLVVEKTGSVLPLKPHKNMLIYKKGNGYIAICSRPAMTPGVYSVIDVEPDQWYTVDIRCTRAGIGLPGLWIGTVNKKTLFYGNFFNEYSPMYLRRKFRSGPYRKLLIGILVKNAMKGSGFFINQFSIEKVESKPQKELIDPPIKNPETKPVRPAIQDEFPKSPMKPPIVYPRYTKPVSTKKEEDVIAEDDIIKETVKKQDLEEVTDLVEPVFKGDDVQDRLDEPISASTSDDSSSESDDDIEGIEEKAEPKIENDIATLDDSLENGDVIFNVLASSGNVFSGSGTDIWASNGNKEAKPRKITKPPPVVVQPKITPKPIPKKIEHSPNQFVYKIQEQNIDFNMEVEIRSYNLPSYSNSEFKLFPIFFGVPEEYVLETVPEKTRDFFPLKMGEDPVKGYLENPHDYWQDLRYSRFIVLGKIGMGWESMIVMEALSQGCIPLFIEDIPPNSLQFLPKTFLNGVKKAKGVHIGWIDHNVFSTEGYRKVVNYLLQYTKNHLTTKALARYIIATTGKDVRSVLVLAFGYERGDSLLQQSVIHGLKQYLGHENVVDVPKVDTLYNKDNQGQNHRGGIPFAGLLEDDTMSRGKIESRIIQHDFDIILVFGCYTKDDSKRLKMSEGCFPYGSIVERHYDKSEIYFVDGQEDPTKTRKGIRQFIHRGKFFRLEYDY